MLKRSIWFRLFSLLALFALLPALPAAAADIKDVEPMVYNVNDYRDLPDLVNNDVCSAITPTDGPCTLRAALDEANTCDYSRCGDYATIELPQGIYTLTRAGSGEEDNSTGDLDITNTQIQIVIEGAGPGRTIIDANGLDRAIQTFYSGTTVTLRELTIRDGFLDQTDAYPNQTGAGISHGNGTMWLDDVVVENNTIACHTANCSSGIGGGIFAYGELHIGTSEIRNNYANRGGGIFYNGGTELIIYHSTFSGNQAVGGGGVLLQGGSAYAVNSTFSGNQASSLGGVANYSGGTLKLLNVTIANNGSMQLFNAGGSTLWIKNSIVTGSTYNCQNSGTWTSYGYNLSSDSNCFFTATGDQTNADPKLTDLTYWGTNTAVHGLKPGSPAHDAKATGICTDFTGTGAMTIDQRGQNRDNKCDIGAFEGVATHFYQYLPEILR